MAAFVLVAAIAPSQIVLQWCPDDPHTLWGRFYSRPRRLEHSEKSSTDLNHTQFRDTAIVRGPPPL